MSDNNQQQLPFFARYLEEQFCEDLSVEETSAVQGGLTLAGGTIYRPPIHPLPIEDEIPIHPVHPRPYPRPRPIPFPHPRPIHTSKITDLYASEI
jgi:Serine endopeptidase inhibitors